MTTYNGRRGPNVSQYLRELRTIPSDGPAAAEETFHSDEDLLKFTNTQFFDFDLGTTTDYQAAPVKPEAATPSPQQDNTSAAASVAGDFGSLDFMSGDFNFGDFSNTYTSPTLGNFSENIGSLQPIQPNPHAIYPAISQHQQVSPYPGPASGSQSGDKRKASEAGISSRPLSVEEAARLAAEEDKRRRNTAASARFRIKKKQREQALEKSAKEMSDKVTALEGRIQQLETENKWLKNLVMEKNGSSRDDMASLFGEFMAKQQKHKEAAGAADKRNGADEESRSSSEAKAEAN